MRTEEWMGKAKSILGHHGQDRIGILKLGVSGNFAVDASSSRVAWFPVDGLEV